MLGCYYLTQDAPRRAGEGADASRALSELFLAYGHGATRHAPRRAGAHRAGPLVKTGAQTRARGRRRRPRPTATASAAASTTTVGRAIFNDILPPGMPFYNYELDKKRAIQTLISRLPPAARPRRDAASCSTTSRTSASRRRRAPACRSARTTCAMPPTKAGDPRRDAEGDRQDRDGASRRASSPRASATSRSSTSGRTRASRVGEDMMQELRDDTRDGSRLRQPDLLHGHVGRAWLGRPDPPARRHARPDGQAVGQDHRDADQGQLPRGPAACSSTSRRRTARARAWPTRRSRRPTPAT